MDMTWLATVLATTDYDSGTTDFGNTMDPLVTSFESASSSLEYWAATIVIILGVIGVFIGTYMLVKNLISKGRTGREQVSWVVVIVTLAIGAAMLFGGWHWATTMGDVLENTVYDIMTSK